MERGQLLKLIPYRRHISKGKGFDTKADRETYQEVFTERVTFVKMSITDNAMVIDRQGNIRLCNPEDLTADFD